MTTPIAEDLFLDIGYRESDGIEVSLLWSRNDDSVWVFAYDGRNGDTFEIPVRPERALDAFNHPFAYLAAASLAA